MDPPFLFKLLSGTRLFRATTVAKEGRWYNLNVKDSYTYGENITEYSTIKDLKLLNAMSLTFHNDFVDRLNVMYPGIDNKGFDLNKIMALIPFGLVNRSMQQKGMSMIGLGDLAKNTSPYHPISDYMGELMHDRNRISEHGLDTHLVSVLETIYGNYYDGFISPLKWPTKVHDGPGDFFPQELCFFKLGNVKEEAQHTRPIIGGAINLSATNTFDYQKAQERIQNIIVDYNKLTENIEFKPLWNPHTEDVIPASAYRNRKTRKRRQK